MRYVGTVLLSVLMVGKLSAQQNVPRVVSPTATGQLVLQLRDSTGLAVTGAIAAVQAEFADEKGTGRVGAPGELRLFMRTGGVAHPVLSSGNGILAIPASQVFGARQLDTVVTPLFILNPSKRLGAIVDVTPGDVNAPVVVPMMPLCFVHGQVESTDLQGTGRLLQRVGASISRPGPRGVLIKSVSDNSRFGMLLPAGSYQLTVGGVAGDDSTCAPDHQAIEVAANQTELDLDTINLASSAMTELLGKPAPELRGIVEWRNGSPITLEKLKGKVVVLDFWAYSCSICIAEMPLLFQLHQRYANNPNLVIIAVHAPNATTLDEAYEKFAAARAKAWHGSDCPFRVALDSPGGTFAAFGVSGVPNTLVIDRNGNLVRRFYNLSKPDFGQEIQQLLNAQPAVVDRTNSREQPVSVRTSPPAPKDLSSHAAPELPAVAVDVLGYRVQKHLTDEQLKLIPGARNGVVVQLMVSAPGSRIVGIDENASTISSFADDRGTELRKYDEGSYWEGPFTREASVSDDGHTAVVEIASSARPATEASKIFLKGSLMVKLAGPQRVVEAKDVLLQQNTKCNAGPYVVQFDEVKTKSLHADMKADLVLSFEGDPDAIESIKFFDPLGREIQVEQTNSSYSDNHNIREYQLSEKPKTVTIRIAGYERLDRVKIPMDVQLGAGL